MAFRYASFVRETSSTTGTGSYSLNGAAAGYRTFAAGIGSGNTCPYAAGDGTDWEVGIGTVTAGAPDTLARTTVLASSNGGAAVAWSSGARTLVCAPLGELAGRLADGSAAAPGLGFVEDADTGLYRIGADHLGLATGGTLALRVDADRRLGIGVDTATALTRLLTVADAVAVRAGGTSGALHTQLDMQLGGRLAAAAVVTSGTTAAVIGTVPGRGTVAIVGGRDAGGAGTRMFADLIVCGLGPMGPAVVSAIDGGTGPASRTYSISGSDLRLAMGADDGGYAVGVAALAVHRG